ncbi:MAG: hypothetical protein QOD86_2215 [Miltoncostaeaceae bacterium]|nr:hypothetical protein [Miltoncostaeaceae bacterium]
MDPDTGIPFRLEGGTPGREPSVVVDYDISRVTATKVWRSVGSPSPGRRRGSDLRPFALPPDDAERAPLGL